MIDILIKEDSEGNPIGYDLTATGDDRYKLNAVRNMIFFGFEETHIKYDGREGDNEFVDKLKWIQKKYKTD